MKSLVVIMLAMFSLVAMAQSPSPVAVPKAAIMAGHAEGFIAQYQHMIVIALGVMSEAVMRAWPTKKPLSWLALAATILIALSSLMNRIAALANNVVADEEAKNPPPPQA